MSNITCHTTYQMEIDIKPMTKKKIFITQDTVPKTRGYIDSENIQIPTENQLKDFKRSQPYKKYVKPVLDQEKQQERQNRREWWWTRGIAIVNLILALIAAITGIISILK